MGGEVGYHSAECRRKSSHIGCDRAAAGSRGFRCGFIGEGLQCHIGETSLLLFAVIGDQIFDNLLARDKRLQFGKPHRLVGDTYDFIFGNTCGALLFVKEVTSGLHKCTFGDEPHDFSAGDADAAGGGSSCHFIECNMERGAGNVGDVHRHLRKAVFRDIPSDCLCAGESAGYHYGVTLCILHRFAVGLAPLTHRTPFFADIKSNGISAPGGCGVEIEVYSDEEVAGADCGCSGTGCIFVERTVAEVRCLVFGVHFLRQSLILSTAANREILALGGECGGFVAIGRHSELVSHPLGKFTSKCGTFFKRNAAYRYKWTNIGGAHARMCSVMLPHVNEFSGFLYTLESGLHNSVGLSDKSHYRAVCGLARINIQ